MKSLSATHRVLLLCARGKLTEAQRRELSLFLDDIEDWDDLLHQAEGNGLAPLLHLHLSSVSTTSNIPPDFARALRFLYLRHKSANTILHKVLREVLILLGKAEIRTLVLKGGALSKTLYSEVGYRPMRDIDLLFHREDVYKAHVLLLNAGYYESEEELPEDYYHLPPLLKKEEGMLVSIEVHSGIFPKDPPYYTEPDFDSLYRSRKEFDVEGITAATFADEEMLYHLFQHGFHAPLTYERPRLVALADIVTLVEERVEELDWQKITARYPLLLNGLAQFHLLAPWSEKVMESQLFSNRGRSSGMCWYYEGWPSQRVNEGESSVENTIERLRSTFYPSKWWTMMYYGYCGSMWSTLYCRMILHPMHLFRWLKVYGRRRAGALVQKR